MLVPDLPCPRGSSSSAHLQIIDQGSNFPSALLDTAATPGSIYSPCNPATPVTFLLFQPQARPTLITVV